MNTTGDDAKSRQDREIAEDTAREEICRVGASLFNRGYVHSTAGNISVRLDDGYLITPTDACLGNLSPRNLSRVDVDLQPLSGPRASKTIAVHAAVLRASGARCAIHTHSTQLVLRSLKHPTTTRGADDLLPPITPYFVMKVGHVPHIPYRRPGDPEVVELVRSVVADCASRGSPVRAVMLERLGPLVWHDTPAQAMALLEELEETAHLINCLPSDVLPLNEAQIEQLRGTFGAAW